MYNYTKKTNKNTLEKTKKCTSDHEKAKQLAKFLGKYKRSGNSYQCLCPAHSEDDPSLSVTLGENGKVLLNCFAGCRYEDILTAIKDKGYTDITDITGAPKSFVQSSVKPVTSAVTSVGINSNNEGVKLQDNDENKALKLWNDSVDISDTSAETYLENRGIDTSFIKDLDNDVLRYNPSLYYDKKTRIIPGLVAKITDKDGEFMAIHRIFLTSAGKKFNLKSSKKSLGPLKGGTVQLTPFKKKMIICEGIEDALILMQCCTDYGVCCFLGSNVPELPDFVEEVIIAADDDIAGQKHARKIKKILQEADKAVGICFPLEGKDFNEYYLKDRDVFKINDLIEKTICEVSNYIAKKTPASIAFKYPSQEQEFFIEGLLPVGGVSILAGHPKVGKSWMALDFAISIAKQTNILGDLKTKKAGVFLCSFEDSRARLEKRYHKQSNETPPDGFFIKTQNKPFDQGGLEEIKKELESSPEIKLLILDPFEKIRPQEQQGKNVYRVDYKDIGLLKDFAAEHEITILLVHHLRKNATGNSVTDLNGSAGLSGAVDTILVLTKDDVTHEHTLKVTGKDVEEQELELEFNSDTGLFYRAQKIELEDTTLKSKILNFMGKEEKEYSPQDIYLGLGKKTNSEKTMIRKQLNKLVENKKIIKKSTGVYAIRPSQL
jgi:DNA primase